MRVRHLPTWQLERELERIEEHVIVEAMLYDGTAVSERALSSAERAWRRIARELARRDYQERSHGRRCTCEDCWALLQQWVHLRRRPGE